MKNKQILSLLLVVLLVGCSKKLSFESQDKTGIKEAYYQQWTSGARGGGSGLSIYIILENADTLETQNIELEGIYFQKYYSSLKETGKNKFQGHIKTNEGTLKVGDIDNDIEKTPEQKELEKDIPFNLSNDEAVISFTEKGKLKYYKLKLKRKELNTIPM